MTRKNGKPKPRPCIVPGCRKPQRARGNCASCEAFHRRLIAAGSATDAELVAEGLWLPSRQEPAPRRAKIRARLRARRRPARKTAGASR